MAYRNLASKHKSFLGPTAPRKRFYDAKLVSFESEKNREIVDHSIHPLTDISSNKKLESYEKKVKEKFDSIVPFLKKISSLQHEEDFFELANQLSSSELGFKLPDHILRKAWVSHLDMKALFAWCVFQSHQTVSDDFF